MSWKTKRITNVRTTVPPAVRTVSPRKMRRNRCLPRQRRAPHVRHVIGVVSGKGGVGKSLVTSLLAVGTQRLGYKAAVLDADITGPSIPQIFGMHGVRITGDDNGMDAPLPPAYRSCQ